MTRVLLACDWLLKYASGLAGGLAAAGAEVALLTRDHALEYGASQEEMRSAIGVLAPGVPLWMLPGRVRDLDAVRPLGRIVRRRREMAPDVVHLQEWIENDVRLLFAAGVRPGRYAYTVHDPVPHPGHEVSPRVIALRRRLTRHAGLVFVHGEALRDELLADRTVTAPVVVVPHGVAAPTPAPAPDSPSVLVFGRITQYKGIPVLLDAMPRVWETLPATRVVIAGTGDLDAAEHPLLEDPRVTTRFEHVPEAEVPALFADASVVALPYTQASQSGVGSVAKAHGRPLVVTATGGLPELVADGSGLVVTAGDPADLASGLLAVLTDPARAAAMGAAAARTAAEGAGWPAVGEATLAAYEEHGLLRRPS